MPQNSTLSRDDAITVSTATTADKSFSAPVEVTEITSADESEALLTLHSDKASSDMQFLRNMDSDIKDVVSGHPGMSQSQRLSIGLLIEHSR